MSIIFAIATIVLVILGITCLFIAMENDRRFRQQFYQVPPADIKATSDYRTRNGSRKFFLRARNAE